VHKLSVFIALSVFTLSSLAQTQTTNPPTPFENTIPSPSTQKTDPLEACQNLPPEKQQACIESSIAKELPDLAQPKNIKG
jgi:hypothetical protein